MVEHTVEELIERLGSDDAMEQVFARQRAARAILALTGTELFSDFDAWRRSQVS